MDLTCRYCDRPVGTTDEPALRHYGYVRCLDSAAPYASGFWVNDGNDDLYWCYEGDDAQTDRYDDAQRVEGDELEAWKAEVKEGRGVESCSGPGCEAQLIDYRWPRSWSELCCSELCRGRLRHADRTEARAAGRAPRPCEVCEVMFEPARSHARYCSNACRQFAHRQRTKESTA